MRSAVDTNVLVSAALAPNSVPARAYELARKLGAIIESSARTFSTSLLLWVESRCKILSNPDFHSDGLGCTG